MKPSIWGLLPSELAAALADLGEPHYRTGQVLRWLYRKGANSFAAMTNLSTDLGNALDTRFDLSLPEALRRQQTEGGQTRKLLLALADGETIETVLMKYATRSSPTRVASGDNSRERATVCVSTQAGCAMGCVFCATGQAGFVRNLTTAEIVAQVMTYVRSGEEVTNVVFMGMGEPLANYAAMWKAVEILNDPQCLGLGARRFTISTVGLIPGIRRLSRERLQVNLAVSLHAPDDDLRRRLIPTAGQPVAELIKACADYFTVTGRRVTFEYVLIDGVNDSDEQAGALADLLAAIPSHVNLIPVNPTPDSSIRRPPRSRTLAFESVLRRRGIACTVRVEKGVEIDSACGQLRAIRAGAGRHGHRRGELPLSVIAS